MSATIVIKCPACDRFANPDRVECLCGRKFGKLRTYYVDLRGADNPKPGSVRTRIKVGKSSNRMAAIAERERIVTEVTTGRFIMRDKAGTLTLAGLRTWYLARAETQLLRSFDIASIQLANIVNGIGASMIVKDLGFGDVEAYRRKRLSAGIAPSTINKECGQLTAALNAAVRAKQSGKAMLFANPIAGIRKLSEDNARDFHIDVDALDGVLLPACRKLAEGESDPEWLARIVEAAFFTLMREGELIRLTRDRADPEFWRLRATDTKNANVRIVTLHPRIRRMMESIKGDSGNGHVFTRAGAPIPAKALQKAMRAAAKLAGLHHPEYGWFRFHDLRHSGAEHYQATGSLDRAILSLGGWETDAMLKRYAAKSHAKLQAGINWGSPGIRRQGSRRDTPRDTGRARTGRKSLKA